MALKIEHLESFMKHVQGYLEAKVDLIKLDAEEQVAGVIIRMGLLSIMFLLFFFTVIFLGIGFSILLNEVLESSYLGYLIVGGIAFFKMVFIVGFRRTRTGNKLFKRVISFMIEE